MTIETNRQSIVTAIEAAKAAWHTYTLNIEYDNRGEIDLALQVDPYLMVDITYLGGGQLDLGTSPLVRDTGTLALAAGVKDGSGTAGLTALLDHFRPYLQMRDDLGAVRTQAAQIHRPRTVNGFYYLPMLVPFWVIG